MCAYDKTNINISIKLKNINFITFGKLKNR